MYKIREVVRNDSLTIVDNIFFIVVCFFLIAFTHTLFFVEFKVVDFFLLVLMYSVPIITLYFFRHSQKLLHFPDVRFVLIVFLIALIGKLASRIGYASLFAEYSSVYDVRNNAHGGSWFSYLAIFFYPSCIIIFYLNRMYSFNKLIYVIIFSFIFFDIVFLAMRMTPTFVLLFWLIFTFDVKKLVKSKLSWLFMLLFFVVLVVVFKETTEMKAFNSELFNWNSHLQSTISTQIVTIREWVVNLDGYDYLKAYVFLSHYLYHSIGEFSAYLASEAFNFFGVSGQITKNATCSVLGCVQDENVYRLGVYKTLYFDFIYDFGLFFAVLFLFNVFIVVFLIVSLFDKITIDFFVFLIILILSPIANFFYGGLGMFQLFCITLISLGSFLLSSKSKGI